jgi:hypothetical protein
VSRMMSAGLLTGLGSPLSARRTPVARHVRPGQPGAHGSAGRSDHQSVGGELPPVAPCEPGGRVPSPWHPTGHVTERISENLRAPQSSERQRSRLRAAPGRGCGPGGRGFEPHRSPLRRACIRAVSSAAGRMQATVWGTSAGARRARPAPSSPRVSGGSGQADADPCPGAEGGPRRRVPLQRRCG